MRVLVTGASGQLGSYLLRELVGSSHEVVAWSGARTGALQGVTLQSVDLTASDCVSAAFTAARPDVVIHAGAMASVAECLRDPPRARLVNVQGTALLATLSEQTRTRLIFVSTDLVFDGEKAPYSESDIPAPLSVYGRTKAEAELAVTAARMGLVVRMSLLYGISVCGRPSFFDQQISALRERRSMTLFDDEWRTPLFLDTAAQALAALAQSECVGLLHVGGPERMSRFEMGQRTARALGLDPSVLVAARRSEARFTEPRPRDVSLDSSRWRHLFPQLAWPSLEEALS